MNQEVVNKQDQADEKRKLNRLKHTIFKQT